MKFYQKFKSINSYTILDVFQPKLLFMEIFYIIFKELLSRFIGIVINPRKGVFETTIDGRIFCLLKNVELI